MSTNDPESRPSTLYERVGGDAFFRDLVERFYQEVAGDPVLRPLYPPDLEPGKAHLALFLMQFWGGPARYAEERGHPRLRQRHMGFRIGQRERDSWVRHMGRAVQASGASAADCAELMEYFERTATFLINSP